MTMEKKEFENLVGNTLNKFIFLMHIKNLALLSVHDAAKTFRLNNEIPKNNSSAKAKLTADITTVKLIEDFIIVLLKDLKKFKTEKDYRSALNFSAFIVLKAIGIDFEELLFEMAKSLIALSKNKSESAQETIKYLFRYFAFTFKKDNNFTKEDLNLVTKIIATKEK